METQTPEIGRVERTDSAIMQDVLREFEWDTRVRESEVGVHVRDGLVSLTGTVENYGQKVAAARAAHRVRGVLDVVDEVVVRLPAAEVPSDGDLAQAVRRALEWDALVDDRRIASTVSNGFVTLEGEADTLAQREDADRAVRRLKGVRGVLDKIRIKPVRADPTAVRRRIEQALERRAEREAERIQVAVENGAVTLTGQVHSWQERDSIVGSAAHAPGVHTVNDRLRIDPWF
jgi:osmotically-inducible protein OsmY